MNRFTRPLFILVALVAGCAAPTGAPGDRATGPVPGGKADGFTQVLSGLRMIGREVSEDGSRESVTLAGTVVDAHYETPSAGDELDVELYAADAASVSDFRLEATLSYEPDGFGGYVSEPIDTSALLPWHRLGVRVHGELADGTPVDETFFFLPGEPEGVR